MNIALQLFFDTLPAEFATVIFAIIIVFFFMAVISHLMNFDI